MLHGALASGLGQGDDADEGFSICEKQATFSNLASLIPRGYTSISEVPHVMVNVEPSENLDPLQELRDRNAKKWKELGFDPTQGKGDMKGSITLSNFKPSQMMMRANLQALDAPSKPEDSQHSSDERQPSIKTSFSMRVGAQKLPRVNSNSDLRKTVFHSDSFEKLSVGKLREKQEQYTYNAYGINMNNFH